MRKFQLLSLHKKKLKLPRIFHLDENYENKPLTVKNKPFSDENVKSNEKIFKINETKESMFHETCS
ncbi:hypothetical protein HMPREF9069_00898 [Atopobium sp. oral taxon 810 str. F0209]|nr:hypothetical protein HMPREF9069_00898 [Atopobium sp. oral taxon 810 str. F0209]